MMNHNRPDDRNEVLFALHRACDDPTAEQILEWVNRFPEFGDDIRSHAVILKDWADREGLPLKEPDESMLARSRFRALEALRLAEVASTRHRSATSIGAHGDLQSDDQLTIQSNNLSIDAIGPISTAAANGPSTIWGSGPAQNVCIVVATLVLGLAYAPNFRDLYAIWNSDPNYSHGKLIIPIALFILWRRFSEVFPKPSPDTRRAQWWGWVALCAVLALRAIAYERNSQWVETATLVPAIACVTWSFGGWRLLRLAWPAIIFLVFLLPLPPGVNEWIALPLQRIAVTGSCFLLQLSGLWAIQEGNVIHVTTPQGILPLDVALACNGLRMLMTMAATITAVIILVPMATWQRITLLASTVPIAMLSNIIRIVVTGWCFCVITGPNVKEWAHDVSGWLMMPLALFLVGVELAVLSWLVPAATQAEKDDEMVILPVLNPRAARKNRQKSTALDDLA